MIKVIVISLFSHVLAVRTKVKAISEDCDCHLCESVDRLPKDKTPLVSYKCIERIEQHDPTLLDTLMPPPVKECMLPEQFIVFSPTPDNAHVFPFQFCNAFCKPDREESGATCSELTADEAMVHGVESGFSDRRIASAEMQDTISKQDALRAAEEAEQNSNVNIPATEEEQQALRKMEDLYQKGLQAVEDANAAKEMKKVFEKQLEAIS